MFFSFVQRKREHNTEKLSMSTLCRLSVFKWFKCWCGIRGINIKTPFGQFQRNSSWTGSFFVDIANIVVYQFSGCLIKLLTVGVHFGCSCSSLLYITLMRCFYVLCHRHRKLRVHQLLIRLSFPTALSTIQFCLEIENPHTCASLLLLFAPICHVHVSFVPLKWNASDLSPHIWCIMKNSM